MSLSWGDFAIAPC